MPGTPLGEPPLTCRYHRCMNDVTPRLSSEQTATLQALAELRRPSETAEICRALHRRGKIGGVTAGFVETVFGRLNRMARRGIVVRSGKPAVWELTDLARDLLARDGEPVAHTDTIAS